MITPHPAQTRFLADGHRFVGCVAGAQGGKTIAAAAKFAARIKRQYLERRAAGDKRAFTAWVVTPTYELATMPQRYLRQRWPRGWSDRRAGIFLQCRPFPGVTVKFRSAEHADKLVSEPVDAIWMNETARMKSDAWRGGLRMRLNATAGWAIWDTTPMGRNWVYTDLYLPALRAGADEYDVAKEHADYAVHTWRTIDNPAVPAVEVEHARATLPAAYFLREYEADFAAFAGQCWPTFEPTRHVVDCDSAAYPEKLLGVDFGYAPGHAQVFLVVGLDRSQKRAAVLEEIVAEGRTIDWWIERCLDLCHRYPLSRAWCDSARPGEIAMLRQAVTRARDEHNRDPQHAHERMSSPSFRDADKRVYDGVHYVASLFGTDSLLIDRSCKVTARQCQTYHWAKGAAGQEWQEKPAAVDNDTCDALRYALWSEVAMPRVSGR